MEIKYATREEVKASLEVAQTARADYLIDEKIAAASRAVESLTHKRFYPERRTVKVDWPNHSYAPVWTLWLDSNQLISVETLTAGGTTIASGDYILRRYDDVDEPPYTAIEINRASNAVFQSGTTSQRAIHITGVFGETATSTTLASATLVTGIDSDDTTITVQPNGGRLDIGVGALILLGTEYLNVVDRAMADTAVNTAGTLEAKQAARLLAVGNGAAFARGEIIMVDAEKMRVDEIAGNNLIVTRSFDGSALDSHLSGVDIYAFRQCTVERHAVGSTAASHLSSAVIYTHRYPSLINELCIAEAVVMLSQNASAYARVVGSGNNQREAVGKGLDDLRERAFRTYGRTSRSGAI